MDKIDVQILSCVRHNSEITKVLGHVLFTTRLDTERTHNKPNAHTLLIHVKYKLYLEYLCRKT